MTTTRVLRTVVIGAAAGLVATMAKSQAEPRLQKVFEAVLPPAPGEKDLVGADPAGAPENMPPAEIVRTAAKALGVQPSKQATLVGQQTIHLVFGTVGGVLYSLLAEAFPTASVGGGVVAGLALYAGTHASVIPLLGIAPPPTKMPAAAVLWESTSHVIYGRTVELVRRLLSETLPA